MNYNTQQESMKLPEYGRIIQSMVKHAVSIEDRKERQNCAETIVSVMANLFPQQKSVPDFYHKLWDHLAYLSDYKLDVDYPYEVNRKEDNPVANVPYPGASIRFKHYGQLVEDLIRTLDYMENSEEKDQLLDLVIMQMQRTMAEWNPDALSNEKIVDDLAYFTEGRIQLDPSYLAQPKFSQKKQSAAAQPKQKKYNKRNN